MLFHNNLFIFTHFYYVLDANQEKIVQEGGLDSLLSLLRSTRNPTIYRVASGAIANLAMNGIADRFFCLACHIQNGLLVTNVIKTPIYG